MAKSGKKWQKVTKNSKKWQKSDKKWQKQAKRGKKRQKVLKVAKIGKKLQKGAKVAKVTKVAEIEKRGKKWLWFDQIQIKNKPTAKDSMWLTMRFVCLSVFFCVS